jgi:aromatic ring-opening dioxygenase LigB subunit
MLVFAAITPSTPLLLPSIHKDKSIKLQRTLDAMDELEGELYASNPDVILLFSEHPTSFREAFSINVSDPYTFDLSAFGDMGIDIKLRPDFETFDSLQRYLRSKNIPVTLTTDNALDHGCASTIAILTRHLQNIKLVPITFSSLDSKTHFQFGQALKDIISNSSKRIAVIASGDMSHALESSSPAGFNKSGKEFDDKLQEIIKQKNTAALIKMDEDIVLQAKQTIYQQTLMLFGLLDHISLRPKILSYEAPFGVGYIVVNFEIR